MQYECQPSLSVVYYSSYNTSRLPAGNTATSRQYGYQPGVPVVYYSILQNITATSRQYGYQPGVSVVYYSILQNITATSRQYGYQPGVPVVYYSILQNITATSRGYCCRASARQHTILDGTSLRAPSLADQLESRFFVFVCQQFRGVTKSNYACRAHRK